MLRHSWFVVCSPTHGPSEDKICSRSNFNCQFAVSALETRDSLDLVLSIIIARFLQPIYSMLNQTGYPRHYDEKLLRPIDNPYQYPTWSPKQQSVFSAAKQFIHKQWRSSAPPRTPLTAKQPMTPLTSASSGPVKFVFMCSLWYTTSALSSNTGKSIMNQFRYPITLTIVQFGFVAAYCLLFMSPAIRFSRLRFPTKAIVQSTLPMGMFQVGGHVFSSIAISRIPVSTVHTIKVFTSSYCGSC